MIQNVKYVPADNTTTAIEIRCYICNECYVVEKYITEHLHPNETNCPNVLKEFHTVNTSDLKNQYEECGKTLEIVLNPDYDKVLLEKTKFFEEINKTDNALKVQRIEENCQREKNKINFWLDFFGIALIIWISVCSIILIAMSFVKLRNVVKLNLNV